MGYVSVRFKRQVGFGCAIPWEANTLDDGISPKVTAKDGHSQFKVGEVGDILPSLHSKLNVKRKVLSLPDPIAKVFMAHKPSVGSKLPILGSE